MTMAALVQAIFVLERVMIIVVKCIGPEILVRALGRGEARTTLLCQGQG